MQRTQQQSILSYLMEENQRKRKGKDKVSDSANNQLDAAKEARDSDLSTDNDKESGPKLAGTAAAERSAEPNPAAPTETQPLSLHTVPSQPNVQLDITTPKGHKYLMQAKGIVNIDIPKQQITISPHTARPMQTSSTLPALDNLPPPQLQAQPASEVPIEIQSTPEGVPNTQRLADPAPRFSSEKKAQKYELSAADPRPQDGRFKTVTQEHKIVIKNVPKEEECALDDKEHKDPFDLVEDIVTEPDTHLIDEATYSRIKEQAGDPYPELFNRMMSEFLLPVSNHFQEVMSDFNKIINDFKTDYEKLPEDLKTLLQEPFQKLSDQLYKITIKYGSLEIESFNDVDILCEQAQREFSKAVKATNHSQSAYLLAAFEKMMSQIQENKSHFENVVQHRADLLARAPQDFNLQLQRQAQELQKLSAELISTAKEFLGDYDQSQRSNKDKDQEAREALLKQAEDGSNDLSSEDKELELNDWEVVKHTNKIANQIKTLQSSTQNKEFTNSHRKVAEKFLLIGKKREKQASQIMNGVRPRGESKLPENPFGAGDVPRDWLFLLLTPEFSEAAQPFLASFNKWTIANYGFAFVSSIFTAIFAFMGASGKQPSELVEAWNTMTPAQRALALLYGTSSETINTFLTADFTTTAKKAFETFVSSMKNFSANPQKGCRTIAELVFGGSSALAALALGLDSLKWVNATMEGRFQGAKAVAETIVVLGGALNFFVTFVSRYTGLIKCIDFVLNQFNEENQTKERVLEKLASIDPDVVDDFFVDKTLTEENILAFLKYVDSIPHEQQTNIFKETNGCLNFFKNFIKLCYILTAITTSLTAWTVFGQKAINALGLVSSIKTLPSWAQGIISIFPGLPSAALYMTSWYIMFNNTKQQAAYIKYESNTPIKDSIKGLLKLGVATASSFSVGIMAKGTVGQKDGFLREAFTSSETLAQATPIAAQVGAGIVNSTTITKPGTAIGPLNPIQRDKTLGKKDPSYAAVYRHVAVEGLSAATLRAAGALNTFKPEKQKTDDDPAPLRRPQSTLKMAN